MDSHSLTGTAVANMAVVRTGVAGGIDVFARNTIDVLVDRNWLLSAVYAPDLLRVAPVVTLRVMSPATSNFSYHDTRLQYDP